MRLGRSPAAVNAVLAGNAGGSFAIKWRMWLFYFFIRLQRFYTLSPRLSLVPKPVQTGSNHTAAAIS